MDKLIDICLTIKGPQGCGKTTFMDAIVPIIAAAAETHFAGSESSLLVKGVETNTKNTREEIRKELEVLRGAESTRLEAQRRMMTLLKSLIVGPEYVDLLKKAENDYLSAAWRLDESMEKTIALVGV